MGSIDPPGSLIVASRLGLSYGAGVAQELVSVDASGLVQADKRLLVGLDGDAFQRGVGDRGSECVIQTRSRTARPGSVPVVGAGTPSA